MPKDILFLLEKDFADGGSGPFYCPESALIAGVLSYYPHMREQIDVRHVNFAKPRAPIVELLGGENQGCPVLVVGDVADVDGINVQTANGNRFISGDRPIAAYLAKRYGIASLHGEGACAISV